MDPTPAPLRWYKRPIWLATLVATIVVPILGAYFVYRQTRLAAIATRPQVKLLTRQDFPFRGPFVEGKGLWVCRAELRLANNGGASTTIVGITPSGPFNEEGYLPDLNLSVGEVGFKFNGFTFLFGLWLPLAIPYIEVVHFQGPFVYRLGITDAGSLGLIPTSPSSEDRPSSENGGGIATANELRLGIKDALDKTPLPFGFGDRLSREISVQPSGLPYEIPAHAVRDAAIDFAVQVPEGFRPDDPRLRRQLQKTGTDPRVGFIVQLSDGPPLRIPPSDCGGLLGTEHRTQ